MAAIHTNFKIILKIYWLYALWYLAPVLFFCLLWLFIIYLFYNIYFKYFFFFFLNRELGEFADAFFSFWWSLCFLLRCLGLFCIYFLFFIFELLFFFISYVYVFISFCIENSWMNVGKDLMQELEGCSYIAKKTNSYQQHCYRYLVTLFWFNFVRRNEKTNTYYSSTSGKNFKAF